MSTTDATACGGPPPALIVTPSARKLPPGPAFALVPATIVGPPPVRSTVQVIMVRPHLCR